MKITQRRNNHLNRSSVNYAIIKLKTTIYKYYYFVIQSFEINQIWLNIISLFLYIFITMDLHSQNNNNESSLVSTNNTSTTYSISDTYYTDLQTFFDKLVNQKQLITNAIKNQDYFFQLERAIQDFIIKTFFKEKSNIEQASQKDQITSIYQEKLYPQVQEMYAILKMQSNCKFIFSLFLISVLNIKEQRLSKLLSFLYGLLNSVLKNIQNLSIQFKVYLSNKIYEYALYIFSNNKQFFKNTLKLQRIIETSKNIKQEQYLQKSVSKISKILNSIICFDQELLGIKKIIKLLRIFYEVSSQFNERNPLSQNKQKKQKCMTTNLYLRLLNKMQYKICKKLQKFQTSYFDEEDILNLIRLLLLYNDANIYALKMYMQIASDVFCNQNISNSSLKLSVLTNQRKLSVLIQKQVDQENQGYGILCTIIKILMKNQNSSQTNFFKQKIFVLCLNFIRYKFSNHVRLFSCIIESFSHQMNRTVLIFCLQFLNEQTVKFISVQKIKSLLKIIAQVANDSIKIKDPLKISKKLFKVKEIIKIFENVANKYKEEQTCLFFNSHPQSVLKIQNIDKTLSFMFVLDLHNDKNKKNSQQPFKIVKFKTSKTQQYQLELSIKTQTDLQNTYGIQGSELNLQSRNTLQIKILSNKVEVIKQIKQYISYSLQNSLQLFVFVSLIRKASKKYHVGFSIDGAYFQIQDSKNACIDQIQIGSFQGILKNLYFFNQELLPQLHKKYIQLKRKIGNILQFIKSNQKEDSVVYKLNGDSQEFILDQKKDKKFFFQKSLNCSHQNIIKSQSTTFLEILRQLGGLQSIFYLIQKLNQINSKQNQADIGDIQILTNMASLDDTGYFLANIQNSFNYINEFLFLLLKRNQLLSSNSSLSVQVLQSIFGFIIFFVNENYRSNRIQKISNNANKKNYLIMFQIQIRFVRDVLCNFQLWAECCPEIQLYVLRLLDGYFNEIKFTSQFVRLDLHKKLIFSTTFYSFQKQLKIQQKITGLCKVLYQNYLSLPVSQIFNFNQFQNTKKLQKKDLLFVLEGCIHRDVNTCMSIIYYLLNSRAQIRPQSRVILNLCNYFIQNFIQREEIFKKINEDWVYVMYQFQIFLDRQIQEEVKMALLKIIFCISFTNKSLSKEYLNFQWVAKSIQNILKSHTNFISCLECALAVLDMNQLFKLPIFQILFQHLEQQLKNADKLQFMKDVLENTQKFSNLIQKMNRFQLTFFQQYLKFQKCLDDILENNFSQLQEKFNQTLKSIRQSVFTNKLKIFTKVYDEGIIQKQNSQWLIYNFSRHLSEKGQKQQQNKQINVEKQFLVKTIHPMSNFKLLQYCSCKGLLKFFKLNDFFNIQPKFLLFHLTNSERQSSNMIQGGLVSHFLLKENKSFEEIHFVCDSIRENKDWNSNKQDYNAIFFCSLIIFEEAFKYLFNAYKYQQQGSKKSQKPIQAEIRKQKTLKSLSILSKIHEFIDIELLAKSVVTQKDYQNLFDQINFKKVISNIEIDIERKCFDEKKLHKQRKSYSENISKFCKKFLNDIQKNKKTDIFLKNFIGDIIQKVKYIETLTDSQAKIQQIYKFLMDKTQKDVKFVMFFIERLGYTGRIFLSAQKTLFILHHYKYFMKKTDIERQPLLKSQKITQFQGQPYTTTLIQKFNKNLETQKKKVAISEQNWTKIQKGNEFWLHQDGQLYKNQFFELDEKQTGPFGFYKINIKPVKDKSQKINYPRRKKIADQIAGSENSLQGCEIQNEIVQVQFQDSFKDEDKKQKYKILQVQSIQNVSTNIHRNTLLQPQMMKLIANSNGNVNVNVAINDQFNDFFYCQYITKKGSYAGKLIVKGNFLEFNFISHQDLPNQIPYKFSTGKFHQINQLTQQDKKIISKMKIKLQKCSLFTRRYILRHTAIQLFDTASHKSYFFNLFFKHQKDKLIQTVKFKVQDCIVNRKEEFQKRKFTESWKNGILSNFQYLMLINRYSGRSTNDLAQYPVMPWVIANYNGRDGYIEINQQFLQNPDNLRRLDYPPGKLGDQKFKKLKNRILELDFCEPQDRFLYGTMFSNPTVLYNFFIRLQPFIQLHWQHQGKRIDHADRLFSGIQEQFRTLLTASSDMKQLTPQFYYWPQFLRNRNEIDLGKKQNKQQVNDVILPIWAKTPEQFIFRMRQVLQSHQVSQKLHHWIDFTFGYQIPYQVAEQYDNLYHFNCYEKEQDYFQYLKDQKDIKSLQVSISQFGQVPESIFGQQHPQKYLRRDVLNLDFFSVIRNKSKQKNAEVFGFQTCRDGLIIWSNKGIQFKKAFFSQNYSADEQSKQFPSKGDLCFLMSFQQMSWASLNQGILRLFTKKMMKLQYNIDSDTIDIIGYNIFYAKKSLIVVAQIQNNLQSISRKSILYGHKSQILYIKANKSLDILLSLDYEGYVMIHQMYSLQFLRGFQLNLQKQLKKKQLRQKDNSMNKIIKVCIHEMGYFIFLIDQKILLVYTYLFFYARFLGQAFLEQDIQLSGKKKYADQKQDFTDIQIFSHDKSLLLLSTSKGNIYMIDFIQIKRFSTSFPYKIYGRIQDNVISNVKKIIRQAKTKQNLSFIDKSIGSFRLQKAKGEKFQIYQIIVQYQDGQILCLYEQKYMGKQYKDNHKFKQLGLC